MRSAVRVPWAVRLRVRRVRNALAAARYAARERNRWRAIARTSPRRGEPAVSYGAEAMPARGDVVFGGAVKFALLHERLPNAPRDFNVLYLGSSSLPPGAAMLARLARRRGAAFVWNQDGTAYPGWYGAGWELVNAPRARLLHQADYVLYQSEFCRLAANRFYGERHGGWEVLHNPVDTRRFVPRSEAGTRPLTLLLGGSQYQRYRLERAIEALALIREERPDARLLVAGALSFAADAAGVAAGLVRQHGVEAAVEFVGPYTQADAPALMQRADVLVHTKYNDPCPTVVLEAMASGLPVVYSASGGVPELVGDEAGIGIPAPLDWERDHPPEAAELAAATLRAADQLAERAEAARARAVERFDAERWVVRHVQLFEGLIRQTLR